MFVLKCVFDGAKQYRLPLDEDSSTRDVPLRAHLPYSLSTVAKQFGEYLHNFVTQIPEITLVPEPAALQLRSFVSAPAHALSSAPRALSTQLSLPSSLFSLYAPPVPPTTVNLTVSLKELKAFVAFCEYLARPGEWTTTAISPHTHTHTHKANELTRMQFICRFRPQAIHCSWRAMLAACAATCCWRL